jgi:hypothetical protein
LVVRVPPHGIVIPSIARNLLLALAPAKSRFLTAEAGLE